LIPILRQHGKKAGRETEPPSYLLTYSGPTTRRMRTTVGSFKFYSIPSLPTSWSPPSWLKVEVGILAGKLYFDWDEYDSICKFLGIARDTRSHANSMGVEENDEEDDLRVSEGTDGTSDVDSSETELTSQSDGASADQKPLPAFDGSADLSEQILSSKPFSFTREWLSIRRRGQEFSHSPMGFLCLRKPLREDHAFFEKTEIVVRGEDLKPGKLASTMPHSQLDGAGDHRQGSDREHGPSSSPGAGVATGEMIDFGDHDPSAALHDDDVHVKIRYDSDDDITTVVAAVADEDGVDLGGAGHSAWATGRRLGDIPTGGRARGSKNR